MELRTWITAVSNALPSDRAFHNRTPEELAVTVDAIDALPDLDVERDGLCGDKGVISVYRDKACLHLYFPTKGLVRYTYSDPYWADPQTTDLRVRQAGFTTPEVGKVAIHMIADNVDPTSYLRDHSTESDPRSDTDQ